MNLDDLVLSGALFSNSRNVSPVRSPSRSPSPDPLFPSNDDFTDSDVSLSPTESKPNLADVPGESHMGLGRTGVKGVIRDRNEAVSLERTKRAQGIKETNRRMEKMALTARTYAEDEETRLREKAKEEGRDDVGKRMFERTGRFGHLRELGEAGFLDAIEGEMDGTWIVLHIYDPSLSRCHDVDAVLARLARQYPQTKFLRARAGAVGFASSTRPSTSRSNGNLITISEKESYSDDEDDFYLNDDEEEEVPETDIDVLPTMLVYQSGQLVHNWVRVDWEAEGRAKLDRKNTSTDMSSIEALLRGCNIIESASNGNCGFSSDEDDLALEFGGAEDNDDDLFDL
ncbi:thioredoxin-like protein [Ramaria rubella]|nr:thioredoxin-like protein [Ramaria rubella]